MVAITVQYQGQLHCEAAHGPSGTQLTTDAPKDNQGREESFSPTDLVATALGSCMLTIMGIAARNFGVNIDGAAAHVEKNMSTSPRRIGQLSVVLNIPYEFDTQMRVKLERAALACPVHKSLHPDIKIPVTFKWGHS
ncbi:MAG: OsmC family protein [Litorimonas sp.]